MFGGDVVERLCEDRIAKAPAHAGRAEAQVEDADAGIGLGADDLLLKLVEEIREDDVVAGNQARSRHERDVVVTASAGLELGFDVRI